ncbi:MAG: beta-galactosidase [Ruminococcaceae bacterium]|nr:beta-galactosidase [Oscillospiraceae bacterium]
MKKYINEKFPHFLHGGDYNPEQWINTKEIWDEDMRLMNLANCNEMTVGIFSWATIEPEEGVFDFSFLDEIIDKVYAAGGRVILATPSGARPRWLAEKYPEVLRVTEMGEKKKYGGRHNHCYTSPVYREKVRIINTKLAERYGKHPAVIAWHLSNEYGGVCYCPLCEAAFKKFVAKRYHNDINELNTQWWSTFWSHNYRSFDDVEFPSPLGEKSIHGLTLDFKRFTSYQTTDFMKSEIAAIKAVCPDLPVTTNMMGFYDTINYWEMGEELDIASWDSYPQWHSPNHETQIISTALCHDFYRSLKGRSYLLMESAPGLVNWHEYNKLKRPGVDRVNGLMAIAHGSDSVQYFQWRKSRGSSEKFHGAVVDHEGTENTRVFNEVKKTGATLKAIDEICGTGVVSRVAIVYDWENRWALQDAQGFQRREKKYTDTLRTYYKKLWSRGISVDITNLHRDLSKYDLVIAPMQYMVDEESISNIEAYVRNGGIFYTTYMLGMVNENDLCYLGGFPAKNLKDVFGIWNEEIDTLYPGETVKIVGADGKEYSAVDNCELIHARGAKVLAEYASEFYAGRPALTVNEYGKGKAYYQAFRDDGSVWADILDTLVSTLGLEEAIPTPLPNMVTAHIREDGENRYLFVENYSGTEISGLSLGKEWKDMESGEISNKVDLKDFDIKIFKNLL